MRLLVDAQLPPALARWLGEHGLSATAVRQLGLRATANGPPVQGAGFVSSEVLRLTEPRSKRRKRARRFTAKPENDTHFP
jgi:hypothetical protein